MNTNKSFEQIIIFLRVNVLESGKSIGLEYLKHNQKNIRKNF